MTSKRVIGCREGGLPWELPRDTAHFRNYTKGKYLLVGRKTYEEMEGWFQSQIPLVLTKQKNWKPKEGQAVHSIRDAIAKATLASTSSLVIIGGMAVYRASLPYAQKLDLTIIDADIKSPIRFPNYKKLAEWKLISEKKFPADEENAHAMTFLSLEKCSTCT